MLWYITLACEKEYCTFDYRPTQLHNFHLFSLLGITWNSFFCMYCSGGFLIFFLAFAQIARFILNTCLHIGIYMLPIPRPQINQTEGVTPIRHSPDGLHIAANRWVRRWFAAKIERCIRTGTGCIFECGTDCGCRYFWGSWRYRTSDLLLLLLLLLAGQRVDQIEVGQQWELRQLGGHRVHRCHFGCPLGQQLVEFKGVGGCGRCWCCSCTCSSNVACPVATAIVVAAAAAADVVGQWCTRVAVTVVLHGQSWGLIKVRLHSQKILAKIIFKKCYSSGLTFLNQYYFY